MKITLAQIAPTLNKQSNISTHINHIKKSISKSDLIIFPELSLNGYTLMDSVYDDAFRVDELKKFENLSKDIDILLGCALWDSGKIYNSAIYFSKGKIKHIHYKNSLPNYGLFEEARYFFAGDELHSFDSDFGKSLVVICEDLWSASMIQKIVDKNVDIIYVISASPTRDIGELGLGIEDKWNALLKSTALLSGASVVYLNRVGFEDGLGFWGGSKIVDTQANIAIKLDLYDEAIKTISINQSISKVQKYMLRHN
jgi:predicted amidohydrolase